MVCPSNMYAHLWSRDTAKHWLRAIVVSVMMVVMSVMVVWMLVYWGCSGRHVRCGGLIVVRTTAGAVWMGHTAAHGR
jgi:hypothetical protein